MLALLGRSAVIRRGGGALGLGRMSALRRSSSSSSSSTTAAAAATHPYTWLCENKDSNITPTISQKVGRNLHLQDAHPLNTIKVLIERHFEENHGQDAPFLTFDDLEPVVTTEQCFDELLIAPGHVSRNRSETYYVDSERVLRAHTSAHQCELMRGGNLRFLCTGDVYRRDEIDASHYPVFHQMEGVRVFTDEEMDAMTSTPSSSSSSSPLDPQEAVLADLKLTLESLVRALFGDVQMRWVEAYFPFTEPSLELEIFFEGDWMEVLGSGVIQPRILENCGLAGRHGWAFGLGLERLAMVLFSIPDIRLFWTDDKRFHDQFPAGGEIIKFEPYSKYPPVHKDVTFWLPEGGATDGSGGWEGGEGGEGEGEEEGGEGGERAPLVTFHENDLSQLVRDVAGDLVEKITLLDEFTHPKTGRISRCYRVTYRSMDRSLTNKEIDALQEELRGAMPDALSVELR